MIVKGVEHEKAAEELSARNTVGSANASPLLNGHEERANAESSESRPNPTRTPVDPIAQMSVRPDASSSAKSRLKTISSLPSCPYCHNPVPDAERDEVHFPVAKREGGTETLPGHHLCNLEAEGNIPQVNAVRKSYAVYKACMRMEGAVGHQNRALLRLREAGNPAWITIQQTIKSQRKQALKELSAALKTAAGEDEDIAWLLTIKGIGPVVTGGLVAHLWPLSRFRQISSMWHYCGLHVVDGHKPKQERGKKSTWNQGAFNALLDINQAIKGKNTIRDFYVKFRKIEDEKHPELTKGHRLNRALRRTRKEFLKQLWIHNRHGDAKTDHEKGEAQTSPVGFGSQKTPDQDRTGNKTLCVGGLPFSDTESAHLPGDAQRVAGGPVSHAPDHERSETQAGHVGGVPSDAEADQKLSEANSSTVASDSQSRVNPT